ncbi:hypothetical protein ACFPM0_30675 [Pseudonocardia sulfidoxydans]|uniref:hypothetical protein n=1 Tax=Pseudonocardia sulfidoxydans TaxID=54011 RepID=UPI0036081D16
MTDRATHADPGARDGAHASGHLERTGREDQRPISVPRTTPPHPHTGRDDGASRPGQLAHPDE